MSEEDLKILENYSYTMSTISSATEQDIGIGNLIYKLVQAYKDQQAEIEFNKKVIDKRNLEKLELAQSNLKKSKIIDLMSKQLAGLAIFDADKDEPLILGDKEEVKQYFERKVNSNEC